MLLRTPLFEAHQQMGAKLVDFGGWEMPLHYGSQIDEHHAVRRHAGMFDVSHMRAVEVEGADAAAFLRHAIANNVDKLTTPGRALYSCMLNPDGGVIDDLIVYFLTPTHYRLVVNAGTAEKDIAWLEALRTTGVKGAFDLKLTPRKDVAMIAVQGPQARRIVGMLLPAAAETIAAMKPFHSATVGDRFVACTGYTGEDGFEIIVPVAQAIPFWNELHRAGVRPCGLGARDTLRLEAGMNLYGQDMNDETTPLESGLAWTVEMKTARDFIGRAALETKPLARQMVGLVLTAPGVLRGHQVIHTAKGNGEITSGSFSPTLSQSIALARIPLGVAIGDTVQAEVRGKLLDCRVVKIPFARNGQALV
ncbi:MAG: glycine cleavage system aminomethyltransferase GcvT [Usitatibacteraceae bacterium]